MEPVDSHFILNNNIRQLTYSENILELERPSPDNLPLINRTLAKTKIRRLAPPSDSKLLYLNIHLDNTF